MSMKNFILNKGNNILTKDFWEIEILEDIDKETKILTTDNDKLVMPVVSVSFELESLVYGQLDVGGSSHPIKYIKELKNPDKLTIVFFDNDIMSMRKYYYKWVMSYYDSCEGIYYRTLPTRQYSRTINVKKYNAAMKDIVAEFDFRVIPSESINTQFDLESDSSHIETTVDHDILSFKIKKFVGSEDKGNNKSSYKSNKKK